MDRVNKNVWLVRAAALVIFLLGLAAGALAPRAFYAWTHGDAQERRQDRFERMSEELKLSPEQQVKVQQIFGDTRSQLQELRKESEPRFDEIRRQADERIRQVLTPEQWERFQKNRNDGRARRGGRGGDSQRTNGGDR
jgi:Spy/CpxP family protein refolding chaperone